MGARSGRPVRRPTVVAAAVAAATGLVAVCFALAAREDTQVRALPRLGCLFHAVADKDAQIVGLLQGGGFVWVVHTENTQVVGNVAGVGHFFSLGGAQKRKSGFVKGFLS